MSRECHDISTKLEHPMEKWRKSSIGYMFFSTEHTKLRLSHSHGTQYSEMRVDDNRASYHMYPVFLALSTSVVELVWADVNDSTCVTMVSTERK